MSASIKAPSFCLLNTEYVERYYKKVNNGAVHCSNPSGLTGISRLYYVETPQMWVNIFLVISNYSTHRPVVIPGLDVGMNV